MHLGTMFCVAALPLSSIHQVQWTSRVRIITGHHHHYRGKLGAQASSALRNALGRTDALPLCLSDIQHLSASTLSASTTPQAGALLAALCSGRDDGPVQPRPPQATITCERSFAGTRTMAGINVELQPLCEELLTRVLEVRMSDRQGTGTPPIGVTLQSIA